MKEKEKAERKKGRVSGWIDESQHCSTDTEWHVLFAN